VQRKNNHDNQSLGIAQLRHCQLRRGRDQWRNQPKILWGFQMFDFRRSTVFCLWYRLSTHEM